MNRVEFLKMMMMGLPVAHAVASVNEMNNLSALLPHTDTMPALFLGHGSPMNAIEENEFVAAFRQIAIGIPTPKVVLCVSAHWETKGTLVTAMQHPKTIHDFGGFPKALFDVQYPAPGNPELARQLQSTITSPQIELDYSWGLDHGAWSVIKHLYPKANIPVIQLSLDYRKDGVWHYEFGQQLRWLRKKGVLIVGSGNIVHNLGKVAWDKLHVNGFGYDWAIEANELFKTHILQGSFLELAKFQTLGESAGLAIPTPEHYLPLLYVLALKEKHEPIKIFNDKAVGGSLTMTSVKIG
jgi:4,5-DOPA dioxygenase extradiol